MRSPSRAGRICLLKVRGFQSSIVPVVFFDKQNAASIILSRHLPGIASNTNSRPATYSIANWNQSSGSGINPRGRGPGEGSCIIKARPFVNCGTHLARNHGLSVNCAQASRLPNRDSVLRGASVLQAQAGPASITLDLLTSEVTSTKLKWRIVYCLS
jgi:hypothetical protein